MPERRSRKSGSDSFVVEVPRSEQRECQLIPKTGLVAVWIRLRLEALGKGGRYSQFNVEAGKVGRKSTLQVTCLTWAKELDLEKYLRGLCRRLRPKTLRGWALRFQYVDRMPRSRRKRLSPEERQRAARAVLEALIDGALLHEALFGNE